MASTLTTLSGVTAPTAPTLMPNKNIVSNNAAAAVTVSPGFNAYLGTNATTVAFNFPAAAATTDGTVITVVSQAAVSVSSTWASTGATFLGAPATLAALTPYSFVYHAATTQWIIYG